MSKYVCTVCGFVYDESAGMPDQGIAPGTTWESLPDDWTCPVCGAAKAAFTRQAPVGQPSPVTTASQPHEEKLRELSYAELGAVCSNLSKGSDKQYRSEEAALFDQLSQYFTSKAGAGEAGRLDDLARLAAQDADTSYASAKAVSTGEGDRGALRALTWGEKVTRILSSVLDRYAQQQDALLEHTNVYVCEICGFVYIGDDPPAVCPVCKVPSMKIRLIEKEVA